LVATLFDILRTYFKNVRIQNESQNILIQINEDSVSLNQNESQTLVIQNNLILSGKHFNLVYIKLYCLVNVFKSFNQ
jgi:hypothetical protein